MPINMNIFAAYKRCLRLNSQSRERRDRGAFRKTTGYGGCVYHVIKILGMTEER